MNTTVPKDAALDDAIREAGGVAKLAEKLGVTSQAISQWRRVPADRVLAVEEATGGKISRHDLRSDIYPRERAA